MLLKSSTILLIIVCFATIGFTQGSWEWALESEMPKRISNNAISAAKIGGEEHIFSFLGLDSTKLYTGFTTKSFKYNTVTQVWSEIASIPDTLGRIAASASTINNKIYIIGGYYVFSTGNEISSSSCYVYDPELDTYTNIQAPPTPIDDHVQAVWRDSLLFCISGWSNTANIKKVQIYTPSTDSWATAYIVGDGLFGHSGTIIGDTIYYADGVSNAFVLLNNVQKGVINPLNPTQITWTNMGPHPGLKGYRMGCIGFGKKILWLGGTDNSYNYNGIGYNNIPSNPLNRLMIYDTESNSWTEETNDLLPIMDLRGIAAVSNDRFYTVGGMEQNQIVSNKTLQFKFNNTTGSMATTEKEKNVFVNTTICANNKVKIHCNIGENKKTLSSQVYLLDLTGKIISKKSFLLSNQLEITIPDVKTGIYFLVIKNELGTFVNRTFIGHTN